MIAQQHSKARRQHLESRAIDPAITLGLVTNVRLFQCPLMSRVIMSMRG